MLSVKTAIAMENVISAVVYIEVRRHDQSLGIASGFHLGSGLIATAKHVVMDNAEIVSVGRRDASLKTHISPGGQVMRTTRHPDFHHRQFAKSYGHPDDRVDVAIIELAGRIDRCGPAATLQPFVQLTPQADLLTEGELLMEPVIVVGYPPIPFSTGPQLVAFNAEISATIESRHDHKRHFVISGMARGGFSGSPVLLTGNPRARSENPADQQNTGTVIGIVGRSLLEVTDSSQPALEELGFLAAVSSRAIHETIVHHRIGVPAT